MNTTSNPNGMYKMKNSTKTGLIFFNRIIKEEEEIYRGEESKDRGYTSHTK